MLSFIQSILAFWCRLFTFAARDVICNSIVVFWRRLFTFADRVRDSSAASVSALQSGAWRSGAPKQADALRVMMLTGDSPASAARIGRLLGMDEVHAGLGPAEKLAAVQEARLAGAGCARGPGVIMVRMYSSSSSQCYCLPSLRPCWRFADAAVRQRGCWEGIGDPCRPCPRP